MLLPKQLILINITTNDASRITGVHNILVSLALDCKADEEDI